MGAAEIDTQTQNVPQTERARSRTFTWDESVGPTPIGFGWDAEPLVMDWHGDGRNDLLLTSGGGPLGRRSRVYRATSPEGQGDLRFDDGMAVPALDGLRCLAAIPNRRDSRFDLVGLDPNRFVHLPNQGSSTAPEFSSRRALGLDATLGLGSCRIVQVVAIDWDGDRLVDLLIGVDHLEDYWADSPGIPVEQQRGFNQQGGNPGFDAKGLWRGKPPVGRIYWLRNLGSFPELSFELQPEIVGDTYGLDLGLNPAPLAVAWERVGGLELLVTDRRGWVHLHRNFGDQRPPVLMGPRALRCGGAQFLLPDDRTQLVAADLDGDGRDELVYGTSDGRVFAVHATESRIDVKNPSALLHETSTLWLGGHAVLTAGDLSGAGGLDLVVGDAAGRLHLYKDVGTAPEHRYLMPEILEAGGAPFRVDPGPDGLIDGPVGLKNGFSCPLLVDWMGHDRLDLIVSGAGGEVLLLPNDGARSQPRFGAPSPLRCDGEPMILPPRVRPAAADWGGTGELDLIALDLQGFLCVYPRAGKNEVGRPIRLTDRLGRFLRLDGGFGQAGRCSLWAGDWRGTGRVDVLLGLARGNRHVVPALTGRPLTDGEELATVLLLENTGQGHLVPRPLAHVDGRPLALGYEGCSPMGMSARDGLPPDLLVGLDDGQILFLERGEIQW